jgi:hypothetical protein
VRSLRPLIELNSQLYLRRMRTALSNTPDGFYYRGHRWNRAYYADGYLRISRPHETKENHTYGDTFGDLTDVTFTDAYGREIVAPRTSPK